jgi:2-polyprenyl-3-methyl-5-hydroxy-6-metoxy-1,4-benzoquinol methylase
VSKETNNNINPFNTSLRDAGLSGMFKGSTGQLFDGITINAGDRVVDLGCGDGGASLFCLRQNAEVTAVDFNKDKLNELQEKAKKIDKEIKTIVADAHELPLEDTVANRIICTEVLEHLTNPQAALNELYRIGEPDCLYFLSVPHIDSENAQKKLVPSHYFERPNHIHIFSEEEFTLMVESSGLEVISHSKNGFYSSVMMMIFWSVNQQFSPPWHPALEKWAEAWKAVMDLDKGGEIKAQLDPLLPKSQYIVARKAP